MSTSPPLPSPSLLEVLRAIRRGELEARVAVTPGDAAAIELNALLDEVLCPVRAELVRLFRDLREGRLGGEAKVPAARGAWAELLGTANTAAAAFTAQLRDLVGVAEAVARGELATRLTAPAAGEALALKNTINTMVERLQHLGTEVARVARALDAEGKLNDTAPDDVMGVWKDFRTNVSLAEQVAQVSRSKSEFLANMSHELRTPLNSLLILARLLAENKDGNLSPRQVDYARTIHEAGRDLLDLINEILDLSKLEAQKMHLELEDTALTEVADLLLRTFRPVAEERGLAFSVNVVPGAPALLHTDPRRLPQVLRNLLANAFKFTERGSVRLTIAAQGTEDVTFAVADTGIGISEDKHGRIFEAFEQADGSTSRKYGGTGLGLSISRGFAALMGGELTLASAPGRGSTFTLRLPQRVTVAASSSARPASPAPSPWQAAAQLSGEKRLAGRSVLIVDDDTRNVFALASLLEDHDLRLSFAHGGEEALARLAVPPPVDLVLLDVMMPDLDGYQVLKQLRADPRTRALPVVAVTARALPEDEQRCLDAGATAHLPKPIDPPRLLALLARLLA